ncbi:MAG: LUD domain-containing protein [Bacteroidetes bacterium]|nr:LUD domain-containing protein [Bacteroidota bacterium]
MQIFKTSRSRENILRKVRSRLDGHSSPMPYPNAEKERTDSVFHPEELSPEECFAETFIANGGRFVYCDNEQELLENIYTLYENRGWTNVVCADERIINLFNNNKMPILKTAGPNGDADASITGCESLLSRTGSMLFSSRQYYGRTSTVYYPVHLVVAYANQIAGDIAEAFGMLKAKYKSGLPSMINVNSGPSRTADIEKTLVTGVHGPGEVFCFFVNADK